MGYAIPRASFEPFSDRDKVMMMDALNELYAPTHESLKGLFSWTELQAIISVSTKNPLDPRFAGQALKYACFSAMSEAYPGVENIYASPFLEKLWQLKPFELITLEVWGKGYWAKHLDESPERTEDYIRQLHDA